MKNNMNKFTILFYRYLSSYILLFLIPLILFVFTIYKSSFRVFRKEVEDYNRNKLYQMMEVIDNQLKNLERISVNIMFNKNLYPYIAEDDSYWQNNSFEELSMYLANNTINNEIIDEIILFLNNKSFVFTSRGKMSMMTLFKNIIKIDDDNVDKLINSIEDLEEPVVLKIPKKAQNKEDLVFPMHNVFEDNEEHYTFFAYPAYLYPIPQVRSGTYGTVLFRVNFTKINNMIKTVLGDMVGDIYVFTDKCFELLSFENGNLISIDEVRSLINDNTDTGNNPKPETYSYDKIRQQVCCTINIENKGISIIKIESNMTKYNYMRSKSASHGPFEEMFYYKAMEKVSNIKVNFIAVPSDAFLERKNLAFSSGDIPDIIQGLTNDEIVKYGTESKMLIPLQDLINEYGPNIVKSMQEHPELKPVITQMNGNIYTFP
ncbi:MAG: extracellular solute-binding protein, partial [Clostridiaceae bacterium]|nr:extracellular solute-binding protein [Clostridiaceae bacterium]